MSSRWSASIRAGTSATGAFEGIPAQIALRTVCFHFVDILSQSVMLHFMHDAREVHNCEAEAGDQHFPLRAAASRRASTSDGSATDYRQACTRNVQVAVA